MLYYFWLGSDKEYLDYLAEEEWWDEYIGHLNDEDC